MTDENALADPGLRNRLVGSIYAAALDPDLWSTFVQQLASSVPGVEPIFYSADSSSGRMEQLCVSRQWESTLLSDYLSYYYQVNPWTANIALKARAGPIFCGSDMVSDGEFERTEFYNDYLSKHGDWLGLVGVVLRKSDEQFAAFGLHCSRTMAAKQDQPLRSLVAELRPHMDRALLINEKLSYAAHHSIDGFSHPALIIDSRLRVVMSNAPCERLFAEKVLAVDTMGRIGSGTCPRATEMLHRMIPAWQSSEGSTPVSLPAPDAAQGRLPYLAWTMPWLRNTVSFGHPTAMRHGVQAQYWLVLVVDPTRNLRLSQSLMRKLFGLTLAEARLLTALCNNQTIREYAAQNAITEATVRVQLKSLFHKTQTNRQAELILLAIKTLCRPA